jgi:hypothetical protein
MNAGGGASARFDPDGSRLVSDLFPTTHRATALSTVSAFARIGSLVSPFVALFDPMTTLLVYGVCLVASAAVSAFIYPVSTSSNFLASSVTLRLNKLECS